MGCCGVLAALAAILVLGFVPSNALVRGRSHAVASAVPEETPHVSIWKRSRQRFARDLKQALVGEDEDLEDAPVGVGGGGQQYLGYNEAMRAAPISLVERTFVVHGWRWHSRSVARDARRLQAAAREEEKRAKAGVDAARGLARLQQGYDFLWSFSWTQLRGIEMNLYFPWLRKNLPRDIWPQLDAFEEERRNIEAVGRKLGAEISTGSDGASLGRISTLASDLEKRVIALTTKQEDCFVPLVSAYVTGAEQQRFNFRVVSSLGIWNARTFLVSFSETIKGDEQEQIYFKESVPRVARALIPRWRKQLYEPRTKCLEPLGEQS